jgi:DNA adenine methylase
VSLCLRPQHPTEKASAKYTNNGGLMIPYLGGKSCLASWIISNFPKDYTEESYCEVFGGGGWVLFKKEPSYIETYNDLNKNLVNLFKIIRDNFEEFNHKANWTLHSREMHEEARVKLKDDKFLNDIERALNYAISKTQGFSAQNSFGYCITADRLYSGKWLPFIKRLQAINARLKKVQIECLDFEKCIEKYDSKSTVFYLDPPYIDTEFYYNVSGVNFKASDHKRLAGLLKRIKGKFIVSYYEHPLARELYKKYRIIKKDSVKHSCGATKSCQKPRPRAVELLIMNY